MHGLYLEKCKSGACQGAGRCYSEAHKDFSCTYGSPVATARFSRCYYLPEQLYIVPNPFQKIKKGGDTNLRRRMNSLQWYTHN